MRQQLVHGLFVREQPPAVAHTATAGADVVVYIHGLGESGLCFEQLMADRRLGGWRQLAVDLPGYGKSQWPETPLDFAATAEALVAWLEACELPPAVIVGHSMGGVLGADVARRAPDRVRGFLNVEGNVSFDDCTFSRDAAEMELSEFAEGGMSRLLDNLYLEGLEDRALRGYYASLRLADPRQLHGDSAALVDRSRAETLAAETASVDCPVRYVLGDPRGTGKRSRALLDAAGVRWLAIADAGHWPYLDQHDAFVDVLVAFLASVLEENRSS